MTTGLFAKLPPVHLGWVEKLVLVNVFDGLRRFVPERRDSVPIRDGLDGDFVFIAWKFAPHSNQHAQVIIYYLLALYLSVKAHICVYADIRQCSRVAKTDQDAVNVGISLNIKHIDTIAVELLHIADNPLRLSGLKTHVAWYKVLDEGLEGSAPLKTGPFGFSVKRAQRAPRALR